MDFKPEFYDEHWDSGWDDMKVYGSTARHTRRFIFRLLEGLTFTSVLDAGCGTGVLLQEIRRKYPRAQVTGFEYSSRGLDFARRRLPDGEFRTLDLGKASLGRKFDLITCIDVLEHIPDDRAALKNLLDMTGGYLILSVPLGPLFEVEAQRLGHVHGYSREEVESKLRESGFEILKVIQWGFPFYNLHRRMANRLPAESSQAGFSARKRLVSNLIYALFFLNVGPGGERYYVLCRPGGAV
ncbi:MAG: class I SAM-dependent methyltransferase [Bacteroidota bacterium]